MVSTKGSYREYKIDGGRKKGEKETMMAMIKMAVMMKYGDKETRN